MKIRLIMLIVLNQILHPLQINQTPSANFDERVDKKTNKIVINPTYIILHYTSGCSTKKGFKSLSRYFFPVSSHYLISTDGTISQLVDESKRAWHAGKSSWKKNNQINTYSIGIEIVNPGFTEFDQNPCTENTDIWNQTTNKKISGSSYYWYPFTQAQINSTILLCKDIIQRYNIRPECILGHSDIAPGRKMDPGPLFPWQELAQHGVGIWYDQNCNKEQKYNVPIGTIQNLLNNWGYNAPRSGILDNKTQKVIQAFQMHFRPQNIDGKPDQETVTILQQLLKKYVF